MNKSIFGKLTQAGDYFTAGFFSNENASTRVRFCDAIINSLEHKPLPKYTGTHLYPLNTKSFFTDVNSILFYDYSYPFTLNRGNLDSSLLSGEEKAMILDFASKMYCGGDCIEPRFALAGRGYTHFVPDYGFFIDKGLNRFLEYVKSFDDGGEFMREEIRLAECIIRFVNRIIEYLKGLESSEKTDRLIKAYSDFLCREADDIFGAIVRLNFIFTLDGCDNIGKLDTYLKDYEIDCFTQDVLSELFQSMEKTTAWNVLISEDSEITEVILKASRGQSKPNLCFAIDESTNDRILEEAFDNIACGSNPALYSKKAYIDGLKKIGVDEADASNFAFGGCSETMVAGMTNCGSIDAGINCVQTLCDEINANAKYSTYGELYSAYKRRIKDYVNLICDEVNQNSKNRAKSIPHLVRSLLCRGCVESRKDFNDGGAKYNFSVINICSFSNAVDSLYAIKTFVYGENKYALSDIRDIINDDFCGHDGYLADLKKLKFFGNDNDEVDGIAKDLFAYICECITSHNLKRGENGRFLPACIMFDTVNKTGKLTCASPDGRKCGSDVSDSGGAMTGRDFVSPTALLNSLGKINPKLALGTWIVNIRLSANLMRGENRGHALKGLILGYFADGGIQIQITSTDRQKLIEALDNEELARTIIVRVGGFSARFSSLSREIRQNIIDRSVY